MKCLKCHTEMKIRDGKYGKFYYCPNGGHMTIGVDKYEKIMDKFRQLIRQRGIDAMDDGKLIPYSSVNIRYDTELNKFINDPLQDAMNLELAKLVITLTELDRFISDPPCTVFGEDIDNSDDPDYEDQWYADRPY